MSLSASSSSRLGVRRRGRAASPAIPLVPCPNCGRQAKVYVSGTDEHPGWTFYKCKYHSSTCIFWHWEREYVIYLIDNNVLRGDAAVDALGWAEDRREDLELSLGKKKLVEEWGRGSQAGACIAGTSNNTAAHDGNRRTVSELVVLGRQIVLLLKIVLAMLFFIVVAAVFFIWKK
ncbi:hypothetical protein ACQ4PT_001823 [Festuca glaucescens]